MGTKSLLILSGPLVTIRAGQPSNVFMARIAHATTNISPFVRFDLSPEKKQVRPLAVPWHGTVRICRGIRC